MIKIIERWVERKRNIIENTDVNSIKVEEVRAFFGGPSFLAKLCLEMAVRDGKFARNQDGTYRLITDEKLNYH